MKVSLVLGSAQCIYDDVAFAESVIREADVPVETEYVALNDVGAWWSRALDAWATLHPEKLAEEDPDDPEGLPWIQLRERNGHPGGYRTYARRRLDLIDEAVQPWGGGSASLYGVRVAEHRGAEAAILCGCPLDRLAHHEASRSSHTVSRHLKEYRRGWTRKLNRLHRRAGQYVKYHTRSASGWTRELLDPPTSTWLAQRHIIGGL